MTTLLLVVGGFLLGGAYTIWRTPDRGPRGTLVAAVVTVAGLLAAISGLLRLFSS